MNGWYLYSSIGTVYSALQNITNHIISEGYPTDAISGGEICSSISSQFKIILESISKKAFKLERTGFCSNLTDGIDHLIQKIISYLCLTLSLPRKLKFELISLMALVIK